MESFRVENLTFEYPKGMGTALKNVSFSVLKGEFVTLCGKSGCGKTTLLRLLKPSLAPFGKKSGAIYFEGKATEELNDREEAQRIGFVMQSPDNQIVTDKVWHELAFGLESLGYSNEEIRTRVSEMASFFGIQSWFHKKVSELSGGQKQVLNLASVMAMQPSVLILDEPTSQLDPIAAHEFLNTLERISRELGTTIILSEHRLEEAIPLSDRVIVMDEGEIIADAKPRDIGRALKGHDMFAALPSPMRIYGCVDGSGEYPLTVREGREWLERYASNHELQIKPIVQNETEAQEILKASDVWFRYKKELDDVVKGLDISLKKGECLAIVGGNGAGKTTALSILSGLNVPYRGSVKINGQRIDKIKNLYGGLIGVMPQNPQALFVKKTVMLDLMEMGKSKKEVYEIAALCRIDNLLEMHPYDLSGGELHRAALAKILLMSPQILFMDEPTKGMDAHFKGIFAQILRDLKKKGTSIIMVSHDVEFCAANSDRCAMFFDGSITSQGSSREFFVGKTFYTTSANRMARTTVPQAMLAEDVITACGGLVRTESEPVREIKEVREEPEKKKRISAGRIAAGVIFAVLFVLTCVLWQNKYEDWRNILVQLLTIAEAACCAACFVPGREYEIAQVKTTKLNGRTVAAAVAVMIAVPLTILAGVYLLDDRRYYFISMLILLEIFIPFALIFEKRKPHARELVIISVLCAIAVAGRGAFYMVPQFKPVTAMVIIAGVCFGAETGFLVGAIAAFVSNFFFGQGPWTPWQMFAFGMVGFVAGILFSKGILRRNKVSLCIYGAIASYVIFGGITNPSSVILWQENPTLEMFIASYTAAAPFDMIHAASTVFFLYFIAEPMIDKLERVKEKYGLIAR